MRVWTITQSGSPPRMRGKGLSDDGHFVAYRITPAYAGKRRSVLVLLQADRDHPRICGEKLEAVFPRFDHLGSPPHMRGKVLGECPENDCTRITPAYAGKSRIFQRGIRPVRDHPRICGEKQYKKSSGEWYQGSPPHMRGKAAGREGQECRT